MTAMQNAAQKQLRGFVERIERLEQEKKDLAADIADVYLEAKACGFDVPTMRQLVKVRKATDSEREEQFALLDTYMHAMGMKGLPLGDWADSQVKSGDRLQEMTREDGATSTTISINGGPEVPLETAVAAMKHIKRRKRGEPKQSVIAALGAAVAEQLAEEAS